jgi:cyclase
MITKKNNPCLDIRNGRVVKGVNFEGVQDVEDPVEMAKFYNESGADELVFYDITASFENRPLFSQVPARRCEPDIHTLTVGGGINSVEDFDRALKAGADKVSVNTEQLKIPASYASGEEIRRQCVVLSMDVRGWTADTAYSPKAGARTPA